MRPCSLRFCLSPLRPSPSHTSCHRHRQPLHNRRCLASISPSTLRHDEAPPPVLNHIHLSHTNSPFPSYADADALQSRIRQIFLAHKSSPATTPIPSPVLLSFTPSPTYTLGRRQGTLSPGQASRLRQPLHVPVPSTESTTTTATTTRTTPLIPAIAETDRGGLTTYHGPGQIVLWPILDLRGPLNANLTVRAYARLLEDTTRAVLADLGIQTYLSEDDPGVWVGPPSPSSSAAAAAAGGGGRGEEDIPHTGPERKIAALGVHLRRHITGLGTALNLDVVTSGNESVNPWSRFVPCGLDGKAVTSVRQELGSEGWAALAQESRDGVTQLMARRWAEELALRLGVKGGVRTSRFDVDAELAEDRAQ